MPPSTGLRTRGDRIRRLPVVVLIGAGVIGSYLVSHLARLPGLERLVLIDPDDYDARNLDCQEIEARDVGHPKVEVQARRARRIRPGLEIVTHRRRVEALPAAALRAGFVLTATDSLASRREVADRVWPLGLPWIDAGVQGAGALVRVTTYLPGEGRPCIECAWDSRHYAAADRARSCLDQARTLDSERPVAAAPSGAASGLGALAAALQAQVCQELWDDADPGAFGREFIIDVARHNAYSCRLRRHEHCRRPEHSTWEIRRLTQSRSELTLGQLLDLGARRARQGSRYLQVLGAGFCGELACTGCGRGKTLLRLEPAVGRAARTCPDCRGSMTPVGFARADRLIETALPPRALSRSLAGMGLRSGDVVSVGRHGLEHETHFELC